MRVRWYRREAGALLLLFAGIGQAQTPDTSVADALRSLNSRAGIVFRGQVSAVRHSASVVEIEFQVDEWFKGGVGSTYTLHEWAGLWTADNRRYRVGEQAMLFLHAAGPGGLASPVDGMDGVLPVVGLPQRANEAPVQGVSVDRLRTRLQRPVGAPLSGEAAPMSVDAVRSVIAPPIEHPRAPIQKPVPVRSPGVGLRRLPIEVREAADGQR